MSENNTEKMVKRATELLSLHIIIAIICIFLILNIYLGGGGLISNIMVVILALYIIFLFVVFLFLFLFLCVCLFFLFLFLFLFSFIFYF